MQKRILNILSLFLIIFSMTIFLQPLTAEAGQKSSGWHKSKQFTIFETVKSKIYNLETDQDTIRGDHCGMYVEKGVSLPDCFLSNNKRKLYVHLYENDKDPNLDECVKTYEASFSGRKIKSFSVYKVHKKGNIDEKGDKQGEFYIKYSITYNQKKELYADFVPKGLFSYNIQIY